MLVARVKFVKLCLLHVANLSTCVRELWRRHKQKHPTLSKLPRMANCPTNRRGRPTPEGTQQNDHQSFLSSRI